MEQQHQSEIHFNTTGAQKFNLPKLKYPHMTERSHLDKVQTLEEELIASLCSRLAEEAHGGWNVKEWLYKNQFQVDSQIYTLKLVPQNSKNSPGNKNHAEEKEETAETEPADN